MRYSIDQDNSAWRVVDGEAVLINAETTFYYGLNPTATRIWKLLLDKDLTAEEIADGIASDSDKSSAGIAESIKCFLDELTVERLLTATEATASRPSDERLPGGLGWSAFLSDRERDGTLTITLNVLALLLTAFRNAERYPDITRLLKERRERLVWQPDRRRYLQIVCRHSAVPIQDVGSATIRPTELLSGDDLGNVTTGDGTRDG